MNQSELMGVNQASREKRKEKLQMHHVEIHPERDAHEKIVKGGGHVVHTVMRRAEDGWGEKRAEKPFGEGDHEAMLAHVANELKLPEPEDEEEEQESGKTKREEAGQREHAGLEGEEEEDGKGGSPRNRKQTSRLVVT